MAQTQEHITTHIESGILPVWKRWGETPLEALERLRTHLGLDIHIPMTYAGRLDPAAEGVLVVLSNTAVHKKEEYLALPKTYTAQIVFGLSTDTGDMLGVYTGARAVEVTAEKIQQTLTTYVGTYTQAYPLFSSKPVGGKPLFTYGHSGEVVEVPTHEVYVQEISLVSLDTLSGKDIQEKTDKLCRLVTGDFRQSQILSSLSLVDRDRQYQVATVSMTVGSGFYVRVFADELGHKLGTKGVLYGLIRDSVGGYTQTTCII